MTPPFTLDRIVLLVLFYVALLVIAGLSGRRITTPEERRTFLVLALSGIVAFVSNNLLARIGWMTPLPVVNNLLHSGLWIGLGFPYMWFMTRGKPAWMIFVVFLTNSLILKYVELNLFGTWNGDGFIGLGRGTFVYILGWAAVDGCLPFVMSLAVRLLGRFVPGMVLN